ncbi:alpha/beta hydrolase [Pseudactinotalea terrae]|uniref:alpha/beta hydrolase n=1 Tax=Pseudactinotalea terrae TaxID=1743262 RepID=UPI0012E32BBE|nr:alpha/beta hydrolase-fold protein [Pseudactinotalea terrae]
MSEVPFQPLPPDVDGVRYAFGPESIVRDDVPHGRTIVLDGVGSSRYPATGRTVWVHVPAACTGPVSNRVMVFLDGWWYLDPSGAVRGGIVLDNLTHAGAIPPVVGVFVDPGLRTGEADPGARKNRNIEYDAFDDTYACYLAEEVMPLVADHASISDDPQRWGICGGSSGGNAAFTAAWTRPDRFRRVIAFVSSFAQMPGGNPYPDLLRTEPPKGLRVFMQAARRDLGHDRPEHNWYAENLRVAAALAEAGYDHRLVVGDGGHSANHGGVLLPDALRWLWRD